MLDFNRTNVSTSPLSVAINELIERAEPAGENFRQYLGASAIGSECLRKVQFDWMCDPIFPGRSRISLRADTFSRTLHGSTWSPPGSSSRRRSGSEFNAADGLFCGHADGILVDGPHLPALRYPCLWEHKASMPKAGKQSSALGWTARYALCRTGGDLSGVSRLTNAPALFSVVNADTAERLHFLVPFDAELAQQFSDRAVTIIEATRAGELLQRSAKIPPTGAARCAAIARDAGGELCDARLQRSCR